MALVKWEKDENVAVLTMDNGENRQNLDFGQEMFDVLDEILEDKQIQALVITSSDAKNFSQGVDVPWLMMQMQQNNHQAIKDFMYGMNKVFSTLLTYPIPVIAAINGHAYGNGAILACACDFRFMRSDRGFFCFPEVNLGIPFLPGMLAWVAKAVPQHLCNEMHLTGERKGAAELEAHHVIVKACPDLESLMAESLAFAKSFQKKRGIFGEMKRRKYKAILDVIENEDKVFIESMQLMVMD